MIEKTIDIPESILKAENISFDDTETLLNANTAQDALVKVASIAKGKNQAHTFETTGEMQAWLSDIENMGTCNVGDNLYIVDKEVPDWWISKVLTEVDSETGYYYEIAQLETQKVDLTDVESGISDLESSVNEINDALDKTMLPKYANFSFSGSGWYRFAMLINRTTESALGSMCAGCKIDIRRYSTYGNENSENHIIYFMPTDGGKANFENEISASNELLITKIRYWVEPYVEGQSSQVISYLDVYYSGTTSCTGMFVISNQDLPMHSTGWNFMSSTISTPVPSSLTGSLSVEYEFSANKSYESEIEGLNNATRNLFDGNFKFISFDKSSESATMDSIQEMLKTVASSFAGKQVFVYIKFKTIYTYCYFGQVISANYAVFEELSAMSIQKRTFVLSDGTWTIKSPVEQSSIDAKRDVTLMTLSNGDVLDTTLKNGHYYCGGATNIPTPSNTSGYLDVEGRNATYRKLTWRPYNSNEVYENTCDNGTWTGWQQLASIKNISYTDSSYSGNFPRVIQQAVADGVLTTGTWSGQIVAGGSIGYYSGITSGNYSSFYVHSYQTQTVWHVFQTGAGWSNDVLARNSQIESLNTAVSKLKYEWAANIKCATWQRLCRVAYGSSGVAGATYLLNIKFTRDAVVVSDTFMVTTHHSKNATLTKISGNNYSTTLYKVRLVVNASGDGFFEIYDNVSDATSDTVQWVYCSLIPINTGTVTTYTASIDGTTIPDDYVVAKEMTVTKTDFQSDTTDTINTNLGKIRFIELNNTIGEEAYSKPWLILEAHFDKLEGNYTTYVGRLSAAGDWGFTGSKANDNYASFLVHSYYDSTHNNNYMYLVRRTDGKWYHEKIINESNLAYKDISSSIDVGETGCTANAYIENGQVVINIAIPNGTTAGTTLTLSADTSYAPRILMKGSFLPVNSTDIDNVKVSWINGQGAICIGVRTDLTAAGYVTFTYPLKTS